MGSSSMQDTYHVIYTDEANPFAALVITSDSDDDDEFVDATAKPVVSPDPDWHAEVKEALVTTVRRCNRTRPRRRQRRQSASLS